MLAAKPGTEAVISFITTIHQCMREHYKHKYSTFDRDTPYETKVSQLKWLKEIKAITDEEYYEILISTKTENIIGFGRAGLEN